jgi:DNA invertase Pin-like site-specific DNA recombinase
MKVAIYCRVSTDDKNQNPETQLYALREYCKKAEWEIVEEYIDVARAKDYKHRVNWQKLLADARQHNFKTVLVFRLDRAFRSVNECTNTTKYWHDIGIGFKSLREDVIDTTTSQGNFILHIMAAVAELESSIISERVTAGIARTRAEGNRYGRKKKYVDWFRVKSGLNAGFSISDLSKQLGYTRQAIYRAIKENGGVSKKIGENSLPENH